MVRSRGSRGTGSAKPTARGKSHAARGNAKPGVGKHKHGTYRGFKSKKQWRWAWASHQPWADQKSHRTAGGPRIRYRRLPESKHSGKKGARGPTSAKPVSA
jgi:hypothetical protein